MASDPPSAAPTASEGEIDVASRWRDLLRQVGEDVAGALTSALGRVESLTSTGRIDRRALRALLGELEAARRAGLIGQQLARFGSGRVPQLKERVPLMEAVRDVLTQRAGDAASRAVRLEQALHPIEVVVDASLLHALCDALLDWALANARSPIELRIDMQPWPSHARLHCRFACRPPDEAPSRAGANAVALDSLAWRLLEQIARTMGVRVERNDAPPATRLTLEFPGTVAATVDAPETFGIGVGASSGIDSRPFAGSQVLIVAARRELRGHLRQSIGHLGLIVDCVRSVAEATEYCREGLPHAVIYEAPLADARFADWREQVRREVPGLPFIEITDEGDALEPSVFDASRSARIGRAAIGGSLPSALLSELSKAL